MRKIVLDTNCLLMSLPRISPYRKIWDDFLKGKLTLCVTNEIIEEYLEIIEQKTNANIASNVVSVILSQKNVEFAGNLQISCDFLGGFKKKAYFCGKVERLKFKIMALAISGYPNADW